ncbi:hypothetical protein Hanom_Chr06g00523061 [Helianthus anomalus]
MLTRHKVEWDERYSKMQGRETQTELSITKEAYNNLRLPVVDLVKEALQHDDFMDRLKVIFEPPTNEDVEEEGEEEGDEDTLDG